MVHRRAPARVPGIKVLLYVLRIPSLITITRYLHYFAERRRPVLVTPLRIKDESRDSHCAFKTIDYEASIVPHLASVSYPLNLDRPLNYFSGVKRSQHIVSNTYHVARLAIAISS